MKNVFTGISVIIPCFNAENTIIKCLDSLVACGYSNAELIVVDDKSIDETAWVVQEYIENHKNINIKYSENITNMGAGATRNKGIKSATKEYITFVDADDCVAQNFFYEIDKVVQVNRYDCIIFNAETGSTANRKVLDMFYGRRFLKKKEDFFNNVLVYIKGSTWGKVYKTSLIKKYNVEFAVLSRNEDLVFTKIALSYCNSVYYLNRTLYYYNENTKSLMHNKSLLDKSNAYIAFDLIENKLSNRGFEEELHSMYMIEIIYSTTMTCIRKEDGAKENFLSASKNYRFRDKYYDGYHMKYKICILLFRFRLFRIIQNIIRLIEKS